MASLKDFSSRSLVLVITRSSTVRTSVSSESSDGGGHQEKLGTSMDPSNKNGDLKRFDQAKPGELFRLFTKKKIDCTNRNQEKLETHHQNGDLTLPTKTGTQNWLVEGTG